MPSYTTKNHKIPYHLVDALLTVDRHRKADAAKKRLALDNKVPRKVASFRLSQEAVLALRTCSNHLHRQYSPSSYSQVIENALKLYLAALEEAIANGSTLPGEAPEPDELVRAWAVVRREMRDWHLPRVLAWSIRGAREMAAAHPGLVSAPARRPAAAPP